MTKEGQELVDNLMESIKVITDDYVANLPAEKFIMKINKTVTEDVAVDLPIYRMNTCFAYKVISQDTCIQVQYGIGGGSIGITNSNLAWCVESTKDCSEDEFLELYEKTLLIINEAIFSVEV